MRHPGNITVAITLEPRFSWRTFKNWLMTGVMIAGFIAITIPLIAIPGDPSSRALVTAHQAIVKWPAGEQAACSRAC